MQDEQAVEAVVPAAALDTPSDRVLHSDPHDFAGLYIRHRASFTLHARRYLRDARDADEVVQEAFLRLFLALPELETELQALAYCRRTITNLCIDRFRAQARRPSLVDLESAGAMDLADDDPGDPVVRAEDAAMVRAALSLLSPLHRAALVKREIEEKTLPVIAEELEIPEESVKHVLFRARRALRRILASTSLAPGSDAEIAQTLGKVMRSGSGGVAAFLLLLVLGLGTGPDLRAVPVVGADLPELIPVTEIASAVSAVGGAVSAVGGAVSAVGGAVSAVGGAVGGAVASVAEDVAEVVTSGGGSSTTPPAEEPDAAEPLAGVVPSPSASPAASPSSSPSSSPAAGKASPSASPSGSPSPSTEPSPSRAAGSPSASPSSASSPSASAEPSASGSSSPSPRSEPSSSSSSSPSSEPSSTTTQPRKSSGTKKSPAPSPSPSRSASPAADPDSYQTDGVEWAYDPSTNKFILVPVGSSAETFRDY